MLAMQPSGGGSLLSDQLFLGQAGPGQHCVWKGTAPNQETSFLTQDEQWGRAKGQASTHADPDRSGGHRTHGPSPEALFSWEGAWLFTESQPQTGSWGSGIMQASVSRPSLALPSVGESQGRSQRGCGLDMGVRPH